MNEQWRTKLTQNGQWICRVSEGQRAISYNGIRQLSAHVVLKILKQRWIKTRSQGKLEFWTPVMTSSSHFLCTVYLSCCIYMPIRYRSLLATFQNFTVILYYVNQKQKRKHSKYVVVNMTSIPNL